MTTRNDDLTPQVDGTTDVFTTAFPYVPGTLVLSYNGQIFPKGFNIAQEVSATQFKLSFVPPTDTHTLGVLYEDPNNETTELMRASGRPPSF